MDCAGAVVVQGVTFGPGNKPGRRADGGRHGSAPLFLGKTISRKAAKPQRRKGRAKSGLSLFFLCAFAALRAIAFFGLKQSEHHEASSGFGSRSINSLTACKGLLSSYSTR